MGKLVNGQIHFKASERLIQVFSVFRDDNVIIIRYDEFVIIWGNTLCQKYRLIHYHKMIRSRLRLVGRFLLEIININKNIHDYFGVFKKDNFTSTLDAINILGGLNKTTLEYTSPTTAIKIGLYLKKCCKLLITLCIETSNTEMKKDAEDFFTP